MPAIETYRKRAKRLVRRHEERDYSVGEMVRKLERYDSLTDVQILDMPMPLTLAQEVIAVDAGYPGWEELRVAAATDPRVPAAPGRPTLTDVVPILFVRDVAAAAAWWDRLGFATDFLHGKPPFFGAVSRDGVRIHLRLVARPNFADLAEREKSLVLVMIEVTDVKGLFDELSGREVEIPQRLVRQTWGGLDFQVRDPDGNTISFVEYEA